MLRNVLVSFVLTAPTAAYAGRQPFNEVLDNEVLPARIAELNTRITDQIGTPGGEDETALWWGAALGLSDRVELMLPAEIAVAHEDGATRMTWYAAEIRWRMAKAGPPPPPGRVVPLLRLSVERKVARPLLEGGVDLVLGTNLTENIHTAAMLGGTVLSNIEEVATHGGLGVTGNVTEALRVGGEVFGEVPLFPSGEAPTVAVGPDISGTLGAFWVTGGTLMGLGTGRAYDVSFRLAWGVEF